MSNISFVIGSGFSYPRKIPGVTELGELLSKTKSDNLYYHTSQSVSRVYSTGLELSGLNRVYNEFYEEFLIFYLGKNTNFNYEVFFDYYYSLYRSGAYDENFKCFVENFLNNAGRENYSVKNLLRNFHNIYSHLVSDFLKVEEFYNESSHQNALLYGSFLWLINRILLGRVVNIHTSNHDLLVEDILNKSSVLQGKFSDGYTSLGSKYFAEVLFESAKIRVRHKVRLRFFSDEYKESLRLFKLHGSVDTFIFQAKDETRIKNVPGIWDYFMEETNENGGLVYSRIHADEKYPEFLTGKKSKSSYFYEKKYFKKLFNHFRNNISECDALIIVGYGFGDELINKCILDKFDFRNKLLIVIDVAEKESLIRRLSVDIENFHYFNKSIDDLNENDVEAIMNLINKIS